MKLLGVHVIGEQATEVVHVGVIAMLADATAELFNRSCFNFPTLGDLYKIATYNAYQKRETTAPPPAAEAERSGRSGRACRPIVGADNGSIRRPLPGRRDDGHGDQRTTIADLLESLGGIPARRVLSNPTPGTATERDLIELHERKNRRYELVDGTLVEKAMGFDESSLRLLPGRAL